MGFKATSSVITVSNRITEAGPNTFTQQEVDLQLSPLDNEVFVVLALDVSPQPPEAVPATDTATGCSVSTTSRTALGTIGDNNILGFGESLIRAAGYVDGGVGFQQFSGETPTATLDYIGIIATNNFFIQLKGTGNLAARTGSVRLWGYRAKADAATYAALVQSEVLSVWCGRLATAEEQAIAAINAAEALALSNIQLLREMKSLLPTQVRPLIEPAIRANELQVQTVAGLERGAVRKVSAATRKGRKNLSRALKIANARLRKKNGQLKKGKTQGDVMRLAQRLKKKMWDSMPLRVPIDLGDDEANELYVLGVSIPTINLMFREVAAYVATLTESERRERARIARKIRKSGKI